jgi:hypothetical protein
MAMDTRSGKKPPDHFVREDSSTRLDTGPYIGKIKNNLDPSRSGRLQVYIPDLSGGDEDAAENWRTVSYASPFFGSTTQPDTNKQNAFSKVKHSYGMWAVPPDIGNLVLCTFVAGDPNRGYWFACVPGQLGHHMIPGIGGSYNVDTDSIEDPKVGKNYTKGKPTVVAEFNENDEGTDWTNFVNLKKPVHEEQFKVYLEQGLEEDYTRGIVSSTSQRESPSYVFGISTPGRPLKDTASDSQYANKIQSGDLKESDYAVAARKGGHSFILDDGNFQGKDNLIRLRTAGGHQILMNDSEHVLYIGNDTGSVWVELTGAGHLNIFTANSLNVRAGADLNFHADRDIKLNAGSNIQMSAGKAIQQQSKTHAINTVEAITLFGGSKVNVGSSGTINLNSGSSTNVTASGSVYLTGSKVNLNNGFGPSAVFDKPSPLKFNKLPDTGKQGDKWLSVDGALPTIVPIAPTHEPWKLHQPSNMPGIFTPGAIGENTSTASPGAGVTSGQPPGKELPVVECKGTEPPTDAGPKAAQGVGVKNPASKSLLTRSSAPTVTEGVGPLTAQQTAAVMAQLGHNESGSNYQAENQYAYIGKYQTGAAVLVDQGYIKRDAYALYGNKAVNNASSWTGKDGITSKEEYKNNGPLQEKVMQQLLKSNYKTLTRIGAIKNGDDQCTVAGMLAASHLIGAGGANNWRNTGGGQDANGTTGTSYFNMGRYAVDVLAAPTTA